MQNEVKPQMQVQPASDGEGAMARADLYRAAKNAMKLFQMVQEGQELEGWVQAKITKSADYLDSVYHYMEYQMKFGGGAQASSVDDITGEAEIVSANTVSEEDDEKPIDMEESMNYEQRLKALLEGAKQKAMMMKKKPAKKDEKVEEGKTEVQYDKDGKRTGVKHTSTHKYSDEPHTEPKSQAKGKSAAEKVGDKAADKQQEKDSKDYAKKNPGSVTRYKDGKKVSEASTGDYSAKKAAAGKDIGKPGKMFSKIAKSAEKGGAKSGEAVAGAVLKKLRAKESVQVEAAKPDFLDMDKDGNKKEPMKKAVADKKAGPKKGVNPFAKKNESVQMQKEVVAESADLTRMKQFLTRLNG